MWKTKLCLNIFKNGIPVKEQLALFKKTGFEGFFVLFPIVLGVKLGSLFNVSHASLGRIVFL